MYETAIDKKIGQRKVQMAVEKYYRYIGYTEKHYFEDYTLFVNPKTMEKVRVYWNQVFPEPFNHCPDKDSMKNA